MNAPLRLLVFTLLGIAAFSLVACLKLDEKQTPQDIVLGNPITEANTVNGDEAWFAIAALHPIDGAKVNGAVTAQELIDGTLMIGIRANVKPDTDGGIYTAWLIREDGTDPIVLGTFASPTGDARHDIRYQTAKRLRKTHTRVVISLQKKGTESTPENPIAEGRLKYIQR